MAKLKRGECDGVRIRLGRLQVLFTTRTDIGKSMRTRLFFPFRSPQYIHGWLNKTVGK